MPPPRALAEIAVRRYEEEGESLIWLDSVRARLAALGKGWNKKLPLVARLEAHLKLAQELRPRIQRPAPRVCGMAMTARPPRNG